MTDKLLTQLKKDEDAEIIAISGGRGIIERLKAMGLTEGKLIHKLSDIRMGGPVILMIDRAKIAIGKGMASKIIVKSVK